MPLALEKIEQLLKNNPESVVVIDEAYVDFGTESAVKLINIYPNLLVTHTLSKARSLAGLRVGYALGHKDLIEALIRVKDSFNSYPIDRFAEAGAVAAFEDEAYFKQTIAKVIATREALVSDLKALNFEVLPSGANFIFAKHKNRAGVDLDGAELTQQLRDKSIIIRHFKKPARIAKYLRITIGTDVQSKQLISALKEILIG